MTQQLKQEITLGQAIGFTVTIMLVVIASWVAINVKLADINARVQATEKSLDGKVNQELYMQYMNATNTKLDNIDGKLDKLFEPKK